MNLKSWGGVKNSKCEIISKFDVKSEKKKLVVGSMLSYGDSCLQTDGLIFNNSFRDCILNFNEKSGEIEVESGISFEALLNFIVPKGYFLPVTPGTKFITVGGAIANDVHGKNHHADGNFGHWIISFELKKSNGETLVCSKNENTDLFYATIGGLGLTGYITKCHFKLIPIKSSEIKCETIKFYTIEEFFKINTESKKFKYTVAWVDCLSANPEKKTLKGLYMRGDHAEKGFLKLHSSDSKKNIPFSFPSWSLNKLSVKAFNFLYFNKQFFKKSFGNVHYDKFFYPLDAIKGWNKIYGAQGLFQFQCVLPLDRSEDGFIEILRAIKTSGQGSFLSVLKTFGEIESLGMLSFPKEGLTFALDFPNRGAKTLNLLSELYDIVERFDGRIYPAKDQILDNKKFTKMYSNIEKFNAFLDPQMSSDWWERIQEGK